MFYIYEPGRSKNWKNKCFLNARSGISGDVSFTKNSDLDPVLRYKLTMRMQMLIAGMDVRMLTRKIDDLLWRKTTGMWCKLGAAAGLIRSAAASVAWSVRSEVLA